MGFLVKETAEQAGAILERKRGAMPKRQLCRFSLASTTAWFSSCLPPSLVGFGIGYGLDKVFHTTFLKIVFLFLGVAAGMIELFRELSKDDAGK